MHYELDRSQLGFKAQQRTRARFTEYMPRPCPRDTYLHLHQTCHGCSQLPYQLAAVGIDSLGQQLIQVHSGENNAPGIGHSENGYGRQVDEWHIDDGLGGALGALLSLSLSLADGE